MTFINNLFPENSFEASMKLINTKKNIENNIPKYLEQYGFIKIKIEKGNYYFINYMRNIFLCYRKSDITANTTKSREAKQNLINSLYEMYQYNPNYQLIYGYLIGDNSAPPSDIIFNNMTINVLSGESLLRYLFNESLPSVLNIMQNKVNEIFEPENHTSEVGCNSCINDNNMSMKWALLLRPSVDL